MCTTCFYWVLDLCCISMDNDSTQKETYFVAVKVFVEQNGKLLILKDNFGDWDLPGGRIKKDEFNVPLEQIVTRKLSEELGNDVLYALGKPIVFMRHERTEAAQGNPTVRIFAVGYEATFQGGEIKLSSRHTELQWVDIKTFKPKDYFTDGWLKGVEEYCVLKNN